jgi:hypothetical protein
VAIRTIDRHRLEGLPIMSYTGTGIIRGKWHPEMVPLFAKHEIPMDFGRRGILLVPLPLDYPIEDLDGALETAATSADGAARSG